MFFSIIIYCLSIVLVAVETNEEMDNMVQQAFVESSDSLASFYIGLYFNDLSNEDQDVPPDHLNYDLRLLKYWFTSQIYPFLQIPGPRNFTSEYSPVLYILSTVYMHAFVKTDRQLSVLPALFFIPQPPSVTIMQAMAWMASH